MEFIPHSQKQDDAIFSDSKITALITGIQWGKTTSGALWLKRMIHTYKNKEDKFLVTAPTYKIMEQSTLPEFMKWMHGFGEFNKKESVFKINGGGTVYFRTATEPDSVVGLTKVRAIWSDEAGKYTLYFWDNIQGRAAFCDAPIMLTSSPYSMNWMYKDIVLRFQRGTLEPHIKLIQAASEENKYFPKKELERRRKSMDPRRFQAMFGGKFEKMQGLVYDVFDTDKHIVLPVQFPKGTRFFAGVDWGFTDPFVLLVHAVTPDGIRYQVSETYKSGLTVADMARIAQEKKSIFNIERFYCDPSNPGAIEQFNRLGVTAVQADNSITSGVDAVYELIKNNKLYLFEKVNRNTEDEIESYHYPEPQELKPDQNAREVKPVGQNDHAMDALRYVVVGTQSVARLTASKITKNLFRGTLFEKFEKLKKRNNFTNTEMWS